MVNGGMRRGARGRASGEHRWRLYTHTMWRQYGFATYNATLHTIAGLLKCTGSGWMDR